MKSKPKVLVVAKDQFGYSTTVFKHCQYLMDTFEVTYLGWDYGRDKINLEGISVKYVSREGNKLIRTFRLVKTARKELMNCDIGFGTYFLGISLLKILGIRKKHIVYIDTLYVETGGLQKFISDTILRFEILFFKELMVISKGVAQKLKLKNYKILPLGGEPFKELNKSDKKLSLLYVGTLGRRKILESVMGFHLFLEQSQNIKNYEYTVIGDSDNGERDEILSFVERHNLKENIHLPGFVPQHELKSFYNAANVGVSFVPLYEEYDHQPPTKTYEYLVSGLPVIATTTSSNKEIVTEEDGFLVKDTPESFCEGLMKMSLSISNYDSEEIKKRNEQYKWRNVIEKDLIPVLNKSIVE